MSDSAAATAKPSRQEQLLLYRLLGSTVPLKEGGGVIFPHGFPGVGYRLEEWQFERYRARLDRAMLSDAARRRQRIMFLLMIAFAVAVLALAFGAPLLNEHPSVAPILDRWNLSFSSGPLLTLLIIAAFVFRRMQSVLVMQDNKETPSFGERPKVGRFAYLPRRVLGMLASGQVSVTAQHVRMSLGGVFALLFIALGTSDAAFRFENLFLAAILLLYAARPSYFCWIYWSFRFKHGRAPTPGDLEPI